MLSKPSINEIRLYTTAIPALEYSVKKHRTAIFSHIVSRKISHTTNIFFSYINTSLLLESCGVN